MTNMCPEERMLRDIMVRDETTGELEKEIVRLNKEISARDETIINHLSRLEQTTEELRRVRRVLDSRPEVGTVFVVTAWRDDGVEIKAVCSTRAKADLLAAFGEWDVQSIEIDGIKAATDD